MPQGFFPQIWDNDEKMQSLFLNFRNKELNPQGWEEKLHFWKNLIIKWSLETKTTTFDLNTLHKVFRRKQETPACLETVLQIMKREGELVALEELACRDSWLLWSWDLLIRRPTSWLLPSFLQTASTSLFVNPALLEELGREVLSWHRGLAGEDWTQDLVELSHLASRLPHIPRSDLLLVLNHLQASNHLRIYHLPNDTKVVKFASEHSKLSRSLTEIDRSVLELKRISSVLEKEISVLETHIDRLKERALAHFKAGAKNKALQVMRKAKSQERLLHKKEGTLENLQQLEITLKNTHSEKLILEALHGGASTLKNILSGELNPDRLDNTMAGVEEALEQHQDINQMLGTPVVGFSTVDDSELEAELDSILDNSELPNPLLPEVPAELPTAQRPHPLPTRKLAATSL